MNKYVCPECGGNEFVKKIVDLEGWESFTVDENTGDIYYEDFDTDFQSGRVSRIRCMSCDRAFDYDDEYEFVENELLKEESCTYSVGDKFRLVGWHIDEANIFIDSIYILLYREGLVLMCIKGEGGEVETTLFNRGVDYDGNLRNIPTYVMRSVFGKGIFEKVEE